MKKNEAAKKLGRLGGIKRAQRLSADRKKEIASLGARARIESLQAASRIEANFRYLNAMDDLRGKLKRISKSLHPKTRLPGIYTRR